MTNPNDAAYPQVIPVMKQETRTVQGLETHTGKSFKIGEHYVEGLSKREYFAAMAMQALVANPANYEFFQKTKINPGEVREQTAITAIQFADALIAELNK